MGFKEISYGVRIQFIQVIICLISVLHFTDVFRRTDYMPPVDNISYLLKGQGILLDSKRGVDRQYAVFSAEIRCFDRFSWDPI